MSISGTFTESKSLESECLSHFSQIFFKSFRVAWTLCPVPASPISMTHTYHILTFQMWSWWHPGVFPAKHCDESPDSLSQDPVHPQLPGCHSSPDYASPPSHRFCGLNYWCVQIDLLLWNTKYLAHINAKSSRKNAANRNLKTRLV